MNKLIAILLLFVAASAFGQDSTKMEKPPLYYLYENNLKLALKYNDTNAARSAMYSMLSMDPMDDSLRYNLAYSYYEERQFASALLTCIDVIAQNPRFAGAIEMSGICYEELGLKDKAISSYEKLYMVTENLRTLYNVILLQYELKRYNECEVNLEILLGDAALDEETIVFQLDENKQKAFPLRVAALNLSGMIKKDQGDTKGAREDWNKALEISPDFGFAKTNLEELDN